MMDTNIQTAPKEELGKKIDIPATDFKRGVFSGVSCLYRKNLAGQFEVFAPHIGVVNSHHETPQGFGRWLNTFRNKNHEKGTPNYHQRRVTERNIKTSS
jgi:hypothetical protein